MKISHLIFATMLLAPLLRANDPAAPVSAVEAPATTPAPTAPPAPAAANPTVPDAGFAAPRYEALWTKSPFAVATSETVGEASPDYFLVGIANMDGVFYASVVERQNQEHFLLSSDKPIRGLTLKQIKRSQNGQDTFAEVLKDGQPLTLKLEQPPAAAAALGAPGMPGAQGAPQGMPMPGSMAPQIPMPGAASSFPNNGSVRPFTRFHRPPIHLPNSPPPQATPAPAPAGGTPTPSPTTPPPPPK